MNKKTIVCTMIAFLFLATAAFAQDAEKINATLDEAAALFTAGDYANAALKFEEALAIAPGRASTHYNAAVSFEAAGDKKAAVRHYREYLRLEPKASDKAEVTAWIAALEEKPAAKAGPAAPVAKPAPAAPKTMPDSAWGLKTGAFFCGDDCTGNSDFEVSTGWLAGIEYRDPLSSKTSAAYSVFYSDSSFDYMNVVTGNMTYTQLAAAHLWSMDGGSPGRGIADGLYYGVTLGYGFVEVSSPMIGSESTSDLDYGVVLGCSFGSIYLDGQWIIDESAAALALGYSF